MLLSTIEHEGIRATIEYHQYSYMARLYRASDSKQLVVKAFGNGVSAEDWILQELKLPSSIVLIKYS